MERFVSETSQNFHPTLYISHIYLTTIIPLTVSSSQMKGKSVLEKFTTALQNLQADTVYLELGKTEIILYIPALKSKY